MLDLGWSEIAVVAVLALVVIGPKDLPRVLRTLGRWTRRIRSLGREFQRQMDDIMRETGADEVKREVDRIGRTNIGRSIDQTVDPDGAVADSLRPSKESGPAAPAKAPSLAKTAPAEGEKAPAPLAPGASGASSPASSRAGTD